jgi:hypothetical protein
MQSRASHMAAIQSPADETRESEIAMDDFGLF